MIRVFVVASTLAARERLRALLTAGGLAVAGTAPPARWDEVPPGVDAIVVGDEPSLARLESVSGDGDEAGPAIVAVGDPERTLRLIRGLPLRGFAAVSSDPSADELGAAARAASAGMMALPLSLGLRVVDGGVAGREPEGGDLEEPLTAREREVLERLGDGLSNREIAGRLGISEHTVKFHVSAIYGKLGVSGRAEAVRQGVRRGLISV
jgi:DNA-binding NarL/FixJ family response regulator